MTLYKFFMLIQIKLYAGKEVKLIYKIFQDIVSEINALDMPKTGQYIPMSSAQNSNCFTRIHDGSGR